MKNNPDRGANPLLDDVLTVGDLAGFRETALGLSIDLARRRRRARGRNRLLAAAVIPLLLVIVGSRWMGTRPASSRPIGFNVVHTEALRPEMRAGIRAASVTMVRTGPEKFEIVGTNLKNPGYRVLSDEGLLALFRGRPVGLIGDSHGLRHLVFLDGDDRVLPE